MTPVLPVTLPILADETVTSFTSRLAAENGSPCVTDFCRDIGLDWNGIINGKSDALAALARFSGMALDTLQANSIQLVKQGNYLVRSQEVNRALLCRTRVRVCPECIEGDLRDRGRYGSARRASWQLNTIRNCEYHGIPLVELPREKYSADSYDFCVLVDRHIDFVRSQGIPNAPRTNSRLERYIVGRLNNVRKYRWLDHRPLYVVARTCEMLGVLLLFGKAVKVSECSEHQLWEAGEVGFDALTKGPNGLIDSLQNFRRADEDGGSSFGADLGPFYRWLTVVSGQPAYAPVADIVSRYVFENYPVQKGGEILGRTCKERLLYPRDLAGRHLRLKPHIFELALRELEFGSTNAETGKLEFPRYIASHDLPRIKSEAKNLVLECRAREILRVTERMFHGLVRERLITPQGRLSEQQSAVFREGDYRTPGRSSNGKLGG